MSSVPAGITEFDCWVGQNVIPQTYQYSKGWWDYVEFVRKCSSKFDVENVRVIGHHVVDTPPPEEKLPMPRPLEWTVSIRRRSPYLGPTFGLFDPARDLRGERTEGLAPDFLFGSYRENPAEFSCELADEWNVATLLRLVFYEA